MRKAGAAVAEDDAALSECQSIGEVCGAKGAY